MKPLQQVIAIFNTNITPIANFPGALKLLDVAGAANNWGGDKGDGKFTLLDVIKLADNAAGQDINLVPFEKFMNLVQDLINWDGFASEQRLRSKRLHHRLIRHSDLRAAYANIAGTQQDLNAFLNGLPGGGATDSDHQTAAQVLQSLFSNTSFSLPLITDPSSAIGMLLGHNTNLFQLNLQPQLSFGSGFNPDGNAAGRSLQSPKFRSSAFRS